MVNDNTNPPCPVESELILILENMVTDDIDITARAVIRRHSVLKAASSITRNQRRIEIVNSYKNKQKELRNWRDRVSKISKSDLASSIASKDLRITELEHQVEALTVSHVAMIRLVGQNGGFEAWTNFFTDYWHIIDTLNQVNALSKDDLEKALSHKSQPPR